MAVNYINYFLMVIGVLTVLAAIIMIFIEKLKGEDIYFNIDVKEQEIKKVIEDAEEIISELNYISDVVVQEIEERIKNLNNTYNSMKAAPLTQDVRPTMPSIPISIRPKIAVEKQVKEKTTNIKLNPKQQAVFDLSDQGVSIIEIAKRLNMGQGEVKLILSLKNEVATDE